VYRPFNKKIFYKDSALCVYNTGSSHLWKTVSTSRTTNVIRPKVHFAPEFSFKVSAEWTILKRNLCCVRLLVLESTPNLKIFLNKTHSYSLHLVLSLTEDCNCTLHNQSKRTLPCIQTAKQFALQGLVGWHNQKSLSPKACTYLHTHSPIQAWYIWEKTEEVYNHSLFNKTAKRLGECEIIRSNLNKHAQRRKQCFFI